MKFSVVTLILWYHPQGSISRQLSGDANPPGYSVVNVDVDTVDGPVAIPKSVMGYINSLEGIISCRTFMYNFQSYQDGLKLVRVCYSLFVCFNMWYSGSSQRIGK